MLAEVMNYCNDKINIVVRCYDKILLNVAAYVIYGYSYRSYGMWLLPYLMSVLPVSYL